MIGMTVAHFVNRDGSGTGLDLLRPAIDGRAMALFVLLAGVGISLLTERSPAPDLTLVVRGAVLLVAGILLTEQVARIAIILDEYAIFFVLALGLRRLPDRALLGGSAAAMVVSGFTIQQLGRDYRTDWLPPLELAEQYALTGYYPLLPVVGYLMLGLWIGRQDLFDEQLWARLLAAGAGLVVATDLGARWLAGALDLDRTTETTGDITVARMLDTTGHSGMLAANLAAVGTALIVLAMASLIAGVGAEALRPLISIGRIALTFYVGQALITDHIPYDDLSIGEEYLVVLVIVAGALVVAEVSIRAIGRGPLEAALRAISNAAVEREAPVPGRRSRV